MKGMTKHKRVWFHRRMKGTLVALIDDGTVHYTDYRGEPQNIKVPVNTTLLAFVNKTTTEIQIFLMTPENYPRVIRVLYSHTTRRQDIGGNLSVRCQDWLWEQLQS